MTGAYNVLCCPCLFKDAQNHDAVMTRLQRLEDAQKATVDSCLEEFRHLIKLPMFTKDRALDRLLNLKMVAKAGTAQHFCDWGGYIKCRRHFKRSPQAQAS